MRLVRQGSSAPEMDMILVSRFPQQAKGTAFSTPKKNQMNAPVSGTLSIQQPIHKMIGIKLQVS